MKDMWWMLVVRGLVAILFGLAITFAPGIALTALIFWWGAYVLVDGVVALLAGITGQTSRIRWIAALEGLLGIAAGIISFVAPGVTALTFLYLVAAWAIITGVLELIMAVQLRRSLMGELWMALIGILSVVFGIVLLLSPEAGILSLLWLVAFYAIAFGVMMILLGFRIRGQYRRDRRSLSKQAA